MRRYGGARRSHSRGTIQLSPPAPSSHSIWLLRLWDSLALILFVGWAGGLHLEPALRDFVPPKETSLASVALLAIAAGLVWLWANVSVADGVILRSAAWLFRRWHQAIVSRPGQTLSIASVLV